MVSCVRAKDETKMSQGPYSIWSDAAGYLFWGAAGFCAVGGGWIVLSAVTFLGGAILGMFI